MRKGCTPGSVISRGYAQIGCKSLYNPRAPPPGANAATKKQPHLGLHSPNHDSEGTFPLHFSPALGGFHPLERPERTPRTRTSVR